MSDLDVPYIDGQFNQEKEYWYNKIVSAIPELKGHPEALYGDNRLLYLRLVNEGLISDGGGSGGGGTPVDLTPYAKVADLNAFIYNTNIRIDGTNVQVKANQDNVSSLDTRVNSISTSLLDYTPNDVFNDSISDINIRFDDYATKEYVDGLGLGEGTGGFNTKQIILSNYVKGDGTDEGVALQSALDEARTLGATLLCDVPGFINISSGVTIGDNRGNSPQVTIATLSGRLKIKATAAMDIAVTLRGTVRTTDLELEIDGASLANFGVHTYNTGRSMIGYIHAYRCLTSSLGVDPTGNNNLMDIDRVRAWACGTKHTANGTVVSHTATGGWTGLGSTITSSRWSLSTPLPPAMRTRTWAIAGAKMSDGRFMPVTNLDTVNGTWVEIGHENKGIGVTESITLATAAVNIPYYGDSGAWSMGSLDIQANPNAFTISLGGYGGGISSLTQQYNFAGIIIPVRCNGFSALHCYSEGIEPMIIADHVNHPSAGTQVFLGPGSKNGASIQVIDQNWMGMDGRNRLPPHWVIVREYPAAPITPPPSVPYDLPELTPGTRNVTPGTTQAYSRTSGAYNFRISNDASGVIGLVHLSSPATGSGTGVNLSLLNTDKGQTIEGASTKSLTVFGEAMLIYWLQGTDWKVRQVGASATVTNNISGAPAFIGQTAVSGGNAYIAVGTSSATDWKQITT